MKKLTLVLTLVPLLNACSTKEFASTKSMASVSAQSVGDATASLNSPGCDPSQQVSGMSLGYGGTVAPECLPNAYYGTPGNERINIWLLCTHHETGLLNFKKAYHDRSPIQLAINGNLCTNNVDTIRNLLMQTHTTVSQLRGICPGFVPAKGKLNIELYINNSPTNSLVQYTGVADQLVVHWSSWKNAAEYETMDQLCDQLKSPLVVEMKSKNQEHRPINLSKQVDFNLLGKKNGDKPVRISWFADDAYQLLALPNAKGEVRGIDQLFGDSTQGPDFKFADHGYMALAKHDANSDGAINEQDPVFTSLRLWNDKNGDGIGQKAELAPLGKHGITSISLKFENDFIETDVFGNQLKQRSSVAYRDGAKGWIYDLWFAVRQRPTLFLTQK